MGLRSSEHAGVEGIPSCSETTNASSVFGPSCDHTLDDGQLGLAVELDGLLDRRDEFDRLRVLRHLCGQPTLDARAA